jgi:hypothetical protein
VRAIRLPANADSAYVFLLLGSNTGALTQVGPLYSYDSGITQIIVADVNGDGIPDEVESFPFGGTPRESKRDRETGLPQLAAYSHWSSVNRKRTLFVLRYLAPQHGCEMQFTAIPYSLAAAFVSWLPPVSPDC